MRVSRAAADIRCGPYFVRWESPAKSSDSRAAGDGDRTINPDSSITFKAALLR